MAPRRRREEEEDVEAESADDSSSSSRKIKRRKKDLRDDEGDKENMEVDSDDLNCSQNPDFPVAAKYEAEVGIIEKIVLVNFMCHTMLEVPLGPNVNFIIGKNGSGKSAIMTGLVVGLGGKAMMTSRGNSLKGFIKDKCSSCQVTIKLRNRGKDAFRPEDYGSSILVERRINADGGSSYKIKSHDVELQYFKSHINSVGKVVSNKKDELIHILDQFNIQVDNPVSVLNQDTSRHFLNSSDPKDKYKFFLKATQLEQMSTDYQMIIEQQAIIKNTLDKKQETLPEMHKQVQRLEEKYKDLAQLKSMKEQVEELIKERIWAEIIEFEKKLDPLAKTVEDQRQKEPRYSEKVDKCQDEIAKLEADWTTVQEQVTAMTEEAKSLAEEQQRINTELRQKKVAFREKQSRRRKLGQDRKSAIADRQQLTDRIQEIKQTAMRDLESERQQRQEQLQQKREELHALQSQLSTTNHHKDQLEQAMKRAKERGYQLRTDLMDAKNKLDATERQLKQLRDSKQNKLKIFGSWVPQLLQRIKQSEGRFHRLPIGPIGAHLTLKEQDWAVAVEACLKGYGWSFCCHDNHDAHILKQMMMQVCPREVPNIVASSFKERVYDVSRNRPRCDFPTVFDMLSIENPVIANALIDQLGIETILLIKDPRQAREVMFHRPPAKVRMAYAGNGDQLFGGKAAKSFAAWHSEARYLQKNIQAEVRRLEQELVAKRHDYQTIQSEKNSVENASREHGREHSRAKAKAFREQESTNKILGEIQELEEYEEEELPDVTTLEEEVEQYTQHIGELDEQLQQMQEDFESAQVALTEQDLKNNNHIELIQGIMEKAEQLKTQQQDIQQHIAKEKSHRKHFENKRKELMDAIKKAEEEYNKMKEHVEEKIVMASEVCERIGTRRSVRNLETEILQKQKRIRVEEKNHGKHEVITREYFEAKTKYENIRKSMKSLRKYSKRLDDVMERRAKAYVSYRHFIAVRAKFFFQMMLGQRGYGGRMQFDHGNEALIVQVNVEQGTKRMTKDTRCLSGGERSFSTVSFIMALWEAMESPFRCLDEFDVFMDMVNRRISMDMLLKVAKEQENRQFILLTPQDMSAIGSSRNVRIFKLRDPERGQATLNFDRDARRL